MPTLKGVPILLSAGEDEIKENNAFVRWVHRVRRPSSMYALRASASVADVRLERKLRYDYAKSKARGLLRATQNPRYAPALKHTSAAAPSRAASPRQALAMDSSIPTITGGKRQRSQGDPDHDVRRRQRRRGNPAEGESQIPMSSRTQDIRASLFWLRP